MATNIPPHNLNEIADAIVLLIDDPNASDDDLAAIVKGPDFPTGGSILGHEAIREAYRTGRGSITMRGKAEIIEEKRQPQDRHFGDSVSGLQEPHRRGYCRGARREKDSGYRTTRRSFQPQGHERRRRAAKERDAQSRAQSALQAHAAAVELRLQHAGARAGGRAACRRVGGARTAGAQSQATARTFHYPPQRRHHAENAVRPAQGRRAGAPTRRLPHRARQHRRSYRDRARQPNDRGSQNEAFGAFRALRHSSASDRRHAAAHAGRPRTTEDRRRVRRADQDHRRAAGHSAQPDAASRKLSKARRSNSRRSSATSAAPTSQPAEDEISMEQHHRRTSTSW